ncbi:MAG: hypothetical protein ACRYHQ_24890 [Janthinobacterium lividum]
MLTYPSAKAAAPANPWPTTTANARPAEGGTWALDSIHVQTPATFTVNMPVPAKPGEPARPPVPTTYILNYATQDGVGTWDPTLATPSVINLAYTGCELAAANANSRQVTTIDRLNSATTLRPVAGGRVDAAFDVTGTGYSLRTTVTNPAAGVPAFQLAARQVKVALAIAGISRERSAQVIPALARFAPQPGMLPGTKPSPNPEAIRAVIQAMQGLASGMTLTEVLDDLTVSSSGVNVASTQFRLGLEAKADGGFIRGALDVGLDGLTLPGMGLDTFADLLPHHVALRPYVSNVPTQELLQLLQSQTEHREDRLPPAQVAALFGHGGLKAGLESFALDIGGASFAGKASIDLPAPNAASGTAQVTATDMDALLTTVQANPSLAQAVPVIVFAKGIGRTEGGKLVWDMQFDSSKLLVNGVDLMKMTGR